MFCFTSTDQSLNFISVNILVLQGPKCSN
uniref:Uncharacterized protein n=1 Tax=Rhizophora mucronata TaxID=61149 RepID=A0A2P2IVQ3_RHIMU